SAAGWDAQADAVAGRITRGVTAWLCSVDTVGYQLRQNLVRRGLRVPRDVSITGYDADEPMFGLPSLTSVRVPFIEMGACAMDRARESGRRVACLSNLRQISMAVMMYEAQVKRLPGPLVPAVLDYETVNANPSIISAYYQARELSAADLLMKYLGNSKAVFY